MLKKYLMYSVHLQFQIHLSPQKCMTYEEDHWPSNKVLLSQGLTSMRISKSRIDASAFELASFFCCLVYYAQLLKPAKAKLRSRVIELSQQSRTFVSVPSHNRIVRVSDLSRYSRWGHSYFFLLSAMWDLSPTRIESLIKQRCFVFDVAMHMSACLKLLYGMIAHFFVHRMVAHFQLLYV